MLANDIERILVSKSEIKTIVERLGRELTIEYKDKFPLVIGLLKGCVPFMSDLLKELDFPLEIDYMNVSSYHGGVKSTGDVKIIMDVSTPVKDRCVLIAEDIVDSGRTIRSVAELLKYRGAKEVKIVTLLDKPSERLVDMTPEFVGVNIPNAFVVGYGLDYEERYRNLPYVGTLKPEIYTHTKE